MLLGFADGYRASWEAALGAVTEETFSDNTRAWSGDHCIDPVLVPGVIFANRVMSASDPAIIDLAPTVLRLFGIDVPGYMDGSPIFEGPLRGADKKEAKEWRKVAAS